LVWNASPKYTVGWSLLLMVQGILPVFIVYMTKNAIDGVVAAKDSGGNWSQIMNALWILGLMGAVLLLVEVLQPISAWLRTAQAEAFGDYLADRIHQKAAEVDLSFYESPEYHDLMEQVRGDSSSKPLSLLESFGGVVQNAISLFGMGAVLVTYGWWLPLVLLLGALPALYVALYTDREYHRWWKSTADDRRWTTYYDAMLTHGDAATEMRLFDLSKHFRTLYQTIRSRLRNEKLIRLRRQGYGKAAASVLALVTAVATIGWMAVRVLYNQATLGDLGVFYQIFSRGQGLMSSLLQGVGRVFNNSLYLENLFTFLDLEPKIISTNDPNPPISSLTKGISFKSVTFCYPGSATHVIRDLNLFVAAGSVVALVGVNGAGKSTLIKLLSRFYDTTEGSIEFDGVNVRQFDIKQLRRMMSVLFQFPMQYHALAKENIALGDVESEQLDEAIVTAARRAGAHNFITRLPKQYETLLGKWFVNGTELSGGEWQRLALARAYFRQASIVVLDEPTSFMDSWSEVDWFDRFREMVKGQTGIVITHRFTIAMRADTIHVIEGGDIIESGTHRELLELNGFYAKSWKAQMRVSDESSHRT
jgi:ATP-binding cassette, subfamily B, bacterial